MRTTIKYLIGFAAVLALVFGVFKTHSARVYAQDACNSSACTWVWCGYTEQVCQIDAYGNKTNCQWVTTPKWCCQIPQSGGGSCTCCFQGGCYFNCPGTGGGGGGSGASPTPTPATPATLTAVALQVSPSDTSCTAIHASTTGVNATTFGFTASSTNQPTPQSQSGATPVTFANQPPGLYTLTATPPNANWVVVQPCLYQNGTLAGMGWTSVANGGDTISWEIGYTYGTAWVQTQGGDVYASGTLRSYLPAVTPRVFNADGASGYPGVVTYGTSYDFDSDSLSQGSTLVSSQNWLANATRTTVDYYNLFYHRFGSPTTADYTNPVSPVAQPASRATPYYVVGDMTTSGNWSVGSGQNIVFLVNGNLTLGGRINITGTGFVGFIVNGNIVVDPTVGTTVGSSTSVVDGIYIFSPTGTFRTGTSAAAATAKLVGRGMFIGGNFLLERDLDAYGGNTTDPAELFVYNPQLLLTMPDLMKELPVVWQEVAP